MRILHVNDVAHVAETLAAAQRLLGREVDVRRLDLVAGNRSTAVKVLALPLRISELGSVNGQVKRGGYDVVHIHYAYLGWLGLLGGYPYLLHCHGTDLRSGLGDPLRGPLVRAALRGAGVVVVGTPDLLPLCAAVRPDTVFVPGPIDVRGFSVRPEPEGAFRILLHATFSQVKRSDVAIDSFRLLRERVPGAMLTAFHTGPDRARYWGEPGLELIPPVPHDEVAELIGRHHVILGQFGIGSLGISELEAMAAARPVLCHFAHPEAYPVPPPVLSSQDPARVAGWLAGLAGDPERRSRLGQEGRAWVVANHDSMAVARIFDSLYTGLGAGKESAWRTPRTRR